MNNQVEVSKVFSNIKSKGREVKNLYQALEEIRHNSSMIGKLGKIINAKSFLVQAAMVRWLRPSSSLQGSA